MVMADLGHAFPLVSLVRYIPLLGHWLVPDHFDMERFGIAEALSDLREYRPKLQWITFGSTDGIEHGEGITEHYKEMVRHLDVLIGKYRKESER